MSSDLDIRFGDEMITSVSSAVNNEYIKDFLLGGNCHCKIENLKTGNSFTFKIQRNKNKSNMYFVNVESGEGDIYCGYFYVNATLIDYRKGEKGKVDESDIRIQALLYVLKNYKHLPSYVFVQQLGKCSCCGSFLDDIDSMRSGLCAECRKEIYIK